MSATWHFRKRREGDPPAVEPMQEQFFNHDGFDDPVKPLIREGIQNAIDAKKHSDEVVRVQITLMRGPLACKRAAANRIFDPKIWEHITARKNGLLPDDIPEDGEPCNYLVFEDFGTIGLTGDVGRGIDCEGDVNHFYDFFRAVASTHKGGEKLGKWGIGKHTFWMASRINTVFGFTVRGGDDPKTALMGRTILRFHALGDSRERNFQDGYYGRRKENSEMMLPLSESDEDALALFRNTFKLRRTTEPGLSLVVPWVDNRISAIGRKTFVAGVAEDYFYPILAGRLEVGVTVGDNEESINAENVGRHITDERFKRLIGLAQRMQSTGERYEVEPESPQWAPEMFAPDMLKKMGEDFRNNRNIVLRVKVKVSPKQGRSELSYFDVALCRGDDNKDISGAPYFVRDDINIPEVRTRPLDNVAALVVAEHRPLAKFLGSGENPAHTLWQKKLLSKNYHNVGKLLDFISNSADNIVRIMTGADTEKDRTILADIFPMPGKRDKEPDNGRGASPLSLSRRMQQFIIGEIDAGFSIRNNPKHPLAPGAVLTVRVAYNIRGNPLNKYDANDFLVQHLPREESGMEVIAANGNEIRVKITAPEFSLRVSGFDKNRDIYVYADAHSAELQGVA